jgi:hypothetical protein
VVWGFPREAARSWDESPTRGEASRGPTRRLPAQSVCISAGLRQINHSNKDLCPGLSCLMDYGVIAAQADEHRKLHGERPNGLGNLGRVNAGSRRVVCLQLRRKKHEGLQASDLALLWKTVLYWILTGS